MDVVYFGQQPWDVCWTAKQHLCTRLADRGHRVVYVNPYAPQPTTNPSVPTPASESPNLWLHTPSEPQNLHKRLASRMKWVKTTRLPAKIGMTLPLSVVSIPTQRWLKESIRPVARIYYAVDDWSAFGGVDDATKTRWRHEEELLLREADLALGVSPRLVERFRTVQPRTYLFQNAADIEHFSPRSLHRAQPHAALAAIPHPRLVFVGQLDERLDQDLLQRIAMGFPNAHLIFAGRIKDGVDFGALRQLPNCHFLGYVPYDELPGVLRDAEVCLVPYVSSDLTESCNPLKVYEYLATGLPVVSTALSGLNACGDVIHKAENHQSFLDGIAHALAHPDDGRAARLRRAAENSWEGRTDVFELRLEEALRLGLQRGEHASRTYTPKQLAKTPLILDAKDRAERTLRPARPLSTKRNAARVVTQALGRVLAFGRKIAGRGTPRNPRKILVVRDGALGDLIAIEPMLRALRKRYPRARIVLGVRNESAPARLLRDCGAVDALHRLDFLQAKSRSERLRGCLKLLFAQYDRVLCGAHYFTPPEALFTGTPNALSLYDGHPYQRYMRRLIPLDPTRHEADNNLALAESLGATLAPVDRAPRITANDATADIRDRVSFRPGERVVLLHAGSKRPSRRWPAERFSAMINDLASSHTDAQFLFVGSPDESELIETIRAAIPKGAHARTQNLAGKTSLEDLVALAAHTDLAICNDSGIVHLLHASGAPVLALLGPENHHRWGPYADDNRFIALRHTVPCAPCVRWLCGPQYCMALLTVDEVRVAALELLSPTLQLEPARRLRIERESWSDIAAHGMAIPRVAQVSTNGAHESEATNYPGGFLQPAPSLRDLDETAYAAWCGERDAEYITTERGAVANQIAQLVRSPEVMAVSGDRLYRSNEDPIELLRRGATVRSQTVRTSEEPCA